jgi:prolactin regulatory element-binding protein
MSRIPFEKYDLGYPPWALQFDPYSRGYLVVGGGNGEGQKEVPNRLTLLNVSLPGPITKIAEVEVSDDNPASLGLRASKDGVTAFVGANSGLDARKKGRNEHFRAFDVSYPPRAGSGSGGAIAASRSTTLFSAAFVNSRDGFQRLLKLSPPRLGRDGAKRIGAIASSLSGRDEIVFFDATVAFPTANDVIHRIELDNKAEVNDLDLCEESEGEFGFTYCTGKDVYLGSISYDFAAHKLKSKVEDPTLQHHLPDSSKVRTKHRCLRFINSNHIMLLVNRGPASELQLLKVYPKDGPGNIVLRMALPRRLGAAVDFDTSVLDADQTGDRQVVIAVAGQRNDVSVFTLDLGGKGAARNFRAFTHINGLHELSMKKVLLAPFYSPYDSPQSDPEKPPPPPRRPAFLALASISLSNTIVVDYLPLDTVKTSSPKPRHFLNSSSPLSRVVRTGSNLFVVAFVLLVTLLLAQSVLDARAAQGQASPVQLIPQQIRTFIYQARQDSDPVKQAIHEAAESRHHRLRDLLHHHHGHGEGNPDAKKAVVMRLPEEGEAHVGVEVHDDHESAVDKLKAVRWDDLSPKQQAVWKQRLVGAGRWMESEGETILKSIFFSELAGAVGRAAMGG